MSDEEALLSAIAANPAEDTPRLVYADWLDEHDHHIRAEFIRLQIDIAGKQETLPRGMLDRYVDLFKRNQELIDNYRKEVFGPLAVLPVSTRIEFDRGFVSELMIDGEQFIRHANAIMAVNILPEIAVFDVAWGLESRHEAHPALQVATAIDMHLEYGPLIATGSFGVAESCASAGPWLRLKRLSLAHCRIFDGGVHAIWTPARFNLFPVLTELDLMGNGITPVGVQHLLRSDLPNRLCKLTLSGNPITDEGAIVLSQDWPTGDADKIEYLNMRHTDIGATGRQALEERFGERVDLS